MDDSLASPLGHAQRCTPAIPCQGGSNVAFLRALKGHSRRHAHDIGVSTDNVWRKPAGVRQPADV
ncbi:MAG TPA: hypothetical protein VMV81_07855 [Phycisphaerae bacterium]|nr:hypothetical protein [Phycisphaerae bacterium]